jgi:hypothetical protein
MNERNLVARSEAQELAFWRVHRYSITVTSRDVEQIIRQGEGAEGTGDPEIRRYSYFQPCMAQSGCAI